MAKELAVHTEDKYVSDLIEYYSCVFIHVEVKTIRKGLEVS